MILQKNFARFCATNNPFQKLKDKLLWQCYVFGGAYSQDFSSLLPGSVPFVLMNGFLPSFLLQRSSLRSALPEFLEGSCQSGSFALELQRRLQPEGQETDLFSP
ncbi:MAG TPA: hypothetical protein GXX19_09805 [Syntrophomonadaceae bacterium]|nr:hypothetical protein [Syntrophomonadaceae bacterium]